MVCSPEISKGGGSGVYAFAALYKISVYPAFGLGSIDGSFSAGCLPYQQNFNYDVLSKIRGEVPYKSTALIYINPGGTKQFNPDTWMMSSANTKNPYGYYNAEKLSKYGW